MRLALVLLSLCACGDSASRFVGTWSGVRSTTFTSNVAGSTPVTSAGESVEETISENLNTGDIELSSCGMLAVPNGDGLEIRMMAAPCRIEVDACSLDVTIATGRATVRGDSMTLDYAGSATRDCGGVMAFGTYNAHANLTRKR